MNILCVLILHTQQIFKISDWENIPVSISKRQKPVQNDRYFWYISKNN